MTTTEAAAYLAELGLSLPEPILGALVAKAHRRRSAILSLIKCVAQGGLPLEASALDTCALAAVRLCRGSQV